MDLIGKNLLSCSSLGWIRKLKVILGKVPKTWRKSKKMIVCLSISFRSVVQQIHLRDVLGDLTFVKLNVSL